MAYSPDKLKPMWTCADPSAKQFWQVVGTDDIADVNTDGYITDARIRGMRAGDLVFVFDTDASPLASWLCNVSAINTNGSADLSNGLAITATDSD